MQLKTINCPKNACVQFVPLHLSVRVSLTHLISIHVWASFIPLSQWWYIYVWYIQAFWPCLKVRIVLYFAHVNEVRNRGYYMAARGYEVYLRVLSISHEWAKRTSERYFQHEKIKFVSPSGHVMFCLFCRYWWNSYIKHDFLKLL